MMWDRVGSCREPTGLRADLGGAKAKVPTNLKVPDARILVDVTLRQLL